MNFQNIDYLVEQMADDPQTWAQRYSDNQENLDRVLKLNDGYLRNIKKLEQMIRRERGETMTELTIQ